MQGPAPLPCNTILTEVPHREKKRGEMRAAVSSQNQRTELWWGTPHLPPAGLKISMELRFLPLAWFKPYPMHLNAMSSE